MFNIKIIIFLILNTTLIIVSNQVFSQELLQISVNEKKNYRKKIVDIKLDDNLIYKNMSYEIFTEKGCDNCDCCNCQAECGDTNTFCDACKYGFYVNSNLNKKKNRVNLSPEKDYKIYKINLYDANKEILDTKQFEVDESSPRIKFIVK